VTNDLAAIVERARLTAQSSPSDGAAGERARLERIAQEFEAMLLVQVLRSMRTAGAWDAESDGDTLGAESMFETLDVELASHLARTQGVGLSKELLAAFDRKYAADTTTPASSAAPAPAPTEASYVASGFSRTEPYAASGFSRTTIEGPVDGRVTSSFGWRRDPFTGATKWHRGVDLKAAYGEDVQAAGNGRVVFSGEQGGYGTTVVLEHPDGSRTRYAHLSVALVAPGDAVASGQAIGRAGRSGRATGTHVHFEIIGADGRHVDPTMTMARNGRPVTGQ